MAAVTRSAEHAKGLCCAAGCVLNLCLLLGAWCAAVLGGVLLAQLRVGDVLLRLSCVCAWLLQPSCLGTVQGFCNVCKVKHQQYGQ